MVLYPISVFLLHSFPTVCKCGGDVFIFTPNNRKDYLNSVQCSSYADWKMVWREITLLNVRSIFCRNIDSELLLCVGAR